MKVKEPLSRKSLESMQCGDDKGTIYYYEYPSEDGAMAAESFIKGMLWGAEERSPMHPDIVERQGKVMVVVSARNPEVFQDHVRRPKS
ncbi:MAG TPA: hypothetical protein VM240_12425 [Verrucomicrobiae bacterium]|nr:hypothetical protein [Verrucomicrobiae bacterium]